MLVLVKRFLVLIMFTCIVFSWAFLVFFHVRSWSINICSGGNCQHVFNHAARQTDIWVCFIAFSPLYGDIVLVPCRTGNGSLTGTI